MIVDGEEVTIDILDTACRVRGVVINSCYNFGAVLRTGSPSLRLELITKSKQVVTNKLQMPCSHVSSCTFAIS